MRIYYKYEGGSPSGSHKPNTAVPQAFYCAQDGRKRIATETGAGQWGSALSYATQLYGLECEVFMVGISYRQKPYRRVMMQTFGATVHSSPSPETNAGRAALEADPDSLGSLGLAISEAVERAATDPEAAYSLGSVLNHVLMHQTVIGLEAKEQLAAFGEKGPDVVIGCAGGGSNFAGISFPFLRDKIAGADIEIIAVEPASCPTLTRGVYAYDFGDAVGMAPLVAMHTLGHDFMPPGIHAGGLRYHGMAPLVSHAQNQGLIRAEAYGQLDCFAAGIQFAKAEGILPAPEPTHAIKGVIEAARRAEACGQGAGDPLQPLRPRALRHAGLRRLPLRPPAGSRDAGGRARPRARGDRRLPGGARRASDSDRSSPACVAASGADGRQRAPGERDPGARAAPDVVAAHDRARLLVEHGRARLGHMALAEALDERERAARVGDVVADQHRRCASSLGSGTGGSRIGSSRRSSSPV